MDHPQQRETMSGPYIASDSPGNTYDGGLSTHALNCVVTCNRNGSH